MSATNPKSGAPRALLSLFITAALVVITLVFLNLFQPAIVDGALISIFFWVAAILSVLSLLGLIWHFLRQMAAEGFSFRERLSLGILIPSFVVVGIMTVLSAFNPGNLLAEENPAVNQLFWGLAVLMLLSLISFVVFRRSGGGRRRKKKSRLYYY